MIGAHSVKQVFCLCLWLQNGFISTVPSCKATFNCETRTPWEKDNRSGLDWISVAMTEPWLWHSKIFSEPETRTRTFEWDTNCPVHSDLSAFLNNEWENDFSVWRRRSLRTFSLLSLGFHYSLEWHFWLIRGISLNLTYFPQLQP